VDIGRSTVATAAVQTIQEEQFNSIRVPQNSCCFRGREVLSPSSSSLPCATVADNDNGPQGPLYGM